VPIVPIHNAGSIGFVPDVPPHELPPEAWSFVKNIRFNDNKAEKIKGHAAVFGAPSAAPYWNVGLVEGGVQYWIYAGLADVYATDGTAHKKISKAGGYVASEALGWNGGVIGGIPVLNNGINAPQMWSPVDFATPGLMEDLTGWPAVTHARIVRVYQNYLVALWITKSSVEFPHLVKWSHVADSGNVPSSWDETDPTLDAGENTLGETSDHLVDCKPLRDVNVIYKEDSIWGMSYIGGLFVFRFWNITKEIGMPSRRSAAEVRGRHIVFGADDIVQHDTQQVQTIVDRRMRRWINSNRDPDGIGLSFVVYNSRSNEMWFCFPENGAARPTLAAIWNTQENVWGVRELPESYAHIGYGNVDTDPSEFWNDTDEYWNDVDNTWGNRQGGKLLAASPTTTELLRMDDGDTFAGTSITAVLERQGLAIAGTDRQGQPKVDFDSVKFIRGIRPKMESNGPVDISVGMQMYREGPVTWTDAQSFNPNTDFEIFCGLTGRLMAVKFESTTDIRWKLIGYDVDVDVIARY
jgi:hypothetical protein